LSLQVKEQHMLCSKVPSSHHHQNGTDHFTIFNKELEILKIILINQVSSLHILKVDFFLKIMF